MQSFALLALVGFGAVAASLVAAPGAAGWLGSALALTTLMIAAIDARRFVIPDELNALGFALGLVHAAILADIEIWTSVSVVVLRAAVLALLFFAFRALYRFMRNREGMGLGDVKLAAVAGCWLEWNIIPIAVELAAVSALAAYAIRLYVLKRPLRVAARLPFGLFFAPAIWVGWLLETVLSRQ